MSSLKKFPPLQYNFAGNWIETITPLFKKPAVAEALHVVAQFYMEIAEHRLDEGDFGAGEDALLEMELMRLTSIVNTKKLYWLRETFESDSLAGLSFAIAQELMPSEEWHIIEGKMHTVVTNTQRSIVFDILLFDKISALESLFYAEDNSIGQEVVNTQQLTAYIAGKERHMQEAIAKMRKLLDKYPD